MAIARYFADNGCFVNKELVGQHNYIRFERTIAITSA